MEAVRKKSRGRRAVLSESEKKKRRKVVLSNINKTRIYIGEEIDRWNGLRETLITKSHTETARFLLDHYESTKSVVNEAAHGPHSSIKESVDLGTPVRNETSKLCNATPSVNFNPGLSSTPGLSHNCYLPQIIAERDSLHKESFDCMSGIEVLESSDLGSNVDTFTNEGVKKPYLGSSFVDPFSITIDASEICNQDEDSSDEDYQPSITINLRDGDDSSDNNESSDSEEECNEDLPECHLGPGVNRVTSANAIDEVIQNVYLVFQDQILSLANTNVPMICTVKGCSSDVRLSTECVGSALYVHWDCFNDHRVHSWCSQPLLNKRLHAGDLLSAASILLSGNNYQKVALFAKFLRLPFVCPTTYSKIQKTYLIPSVDEYWSKHQENILAEFRGRPIAILGDGRMDSPGHNAQYCTYTFMENSSKRILTVITMDKRMTDRKSTNLEKACFVKGLQFLLQNGIQVIEVITDQHLQISALMKKDYPQIKHSYDVWHGTKNLTKKLMAAGQEKGNRPLIAWIKDIVSHFWYTSKRAETYEEFIGLWFGILHHTVNEHEWILSYSSYGLNGCEHGPLEDNHERVPKDYLQKGSRTHETLRSIVMDKRLLNKIPYFLNFRSTAELETFQSLILMYTSKRESHKPPAYRVRNRLAALDYNVHIDRPVLQNKNGDIRKQRIYSKRTSVWYFYPVKVRKEYPHIPQVMVQVVKKRLEDHLGMNRVVPLEPDDPRRLSSTLAPIPPPSTEVIVTEQKSRFK